MSSAGNTLCDTYDPARPTTVVWAILLSSLLVACGAEPGPADTGEIPDGPPSAGDDGAACLSPDDCFGSTCLTELESGLPNGYCTSFHCEDVGCHGGECVLDNRGLSACVDTCSVEDDCRPGYACMESGSLRICDVSGDPGREVGVSPDGTCIQGCEVGDPVRIECGFTPSRELEAGLFQWGLPYQLTSGVHGFNLTVWSEDQPASINALSVRNRQDQLLALKGADSALNVNSFVENEMISLVFPFALPYQDFSRVDGGVLQVQSSSSSLCIARAEGLEGDALTLHIYLNGASGLTEELMEVDPDVRKMLTEIQRLLALAGISIENVVTTEMPEEVVERYRILRSHEDFGDLLAETVDPDTDGDTSSNDDSLVLNLVLVDDIALADGSDTIGQAGLLPGPAGLHGTRSSGILAETTSLRENPEYLALIIVHESAHFLGLRHTSELFNETYAFGRTDPLTDTPECPDVRSLVESCPDYENLMFPLAQVSRTQSLVEVSSEQGWVLRHNPLVR